VATLDEVKAALEESVGQELNPKLWGLMVQWKRCAAALRDQPGMYTFDSAIESLAGDYHDLVGTVDRRENLKGRGTTEIAPDARLDALAEILALDAGRLPAVAEFRRKYLPDGLLAEDAVGPWIKTRALEYGETVTFARLRMPTGFPGPRNNAEIADWLEVLAVELREQPTDLSVHAYCEHLLFRAGDDRPARGLHSGKPDYGPEPRAQSVPVSPGTELWELRHLSRQLAVRGGWQEATATNLVLTGVAPTPSKAVAWIRYCLPFEALTRIVIEADPRLPPSEVRSLYGDLRHELRGGGDQRMSEKHIELALFAARDGSRLPASVGMAAETEVPRDHDRRFGLRLGPIAPDTYGQGTTWPELQKRWNRLHPEWAYGDVRARQFGRDVRNAWKRVTGQSWWAPPSFEAVEQAEQAQQVRGRHGTRNG
jgi:hypothetical protein